MVEVVMAMAIVVVAVVGMMQAVTIGAEALDTARKQQIATQLREAAALLDRKMRGQRVPSFVELRGPVLRGLLLDLRVIIEGLDLLS